MGTQAERRDDRAGKLGRHKRQTDIFNPADFIDRHVTIIGLGNIGSHSALALARMGITQFTLVDFDTVEEHNLSSQAYTSAQIGVKKTEALADLIFQVAKPELLRAIDSAYDENVSIPEKSIVVCAVDSMQTRFNIYDMLRKHDVFIVDGRMGGGQVEVHATPANEWGRTLADNPDTDPCAARYISYTSYIVAGLIANTVKRHLKGEEVPRSVYIHTDPVAALIVEK